MSEEQSEENNGIREVTQKDIATTYGRRVKWYSEELFGTARTDYGSTLDITIPQGYHKQVEICWGMYASDRIFRYLIDRMIEFAVNGSEWELPYASKKGFWKFLAKYMKSINSGPQDWGFDEEKAVWDYWSAHVNTDVPNVIPGTDEIMKWSCKQLLLSGMAVLDWEWGIMKIEGREYTLPTKMTVHNSLGIALRRKNVRFVEEDILLKIDKGQKEILSTNKTMNKVYDFQTLTVNGKQQDFIKLDPDTSFAIKYNWSPGDNTAYSPAGKTISVGQGLYPSPPYVALNDVSLLRRGLRAADLAIIDGIVNYIFDWTVGDATVVNKTKMPNQPQAEVLAADGVTVATKSTIDQVKDSILTPDTKGNVMNIFHPYWVKLELKMPDTTTLLDNSKYIQSMIEMYQGFGIMFPPVQSRMDLTEINVQNFESSITYLRELHWKRTLTGVVCKKIVDKNPKLTVMPKYVLNVLNTKTKEFREAIFNLAKIGKVSTETLLQSHGMDSKVEFPRVTKEVKSGEKEIYDENVAVSFVQSTDLQSTEQTSGPAGTKKKEVTKTSANNHIVPKKTE